MALSMLGFAVALLLCEVAARIIDGQTLTALQLRFVGFSPPGPARKLDPTLGGGALPPDIDPAWIDVPPPASRRPRVDRELAALQKEAVRLGSKPFEVFRIWNRLFVEESGCTPGSTFLRLPQPMLVFDPPEPSHFPTYRYLPSRTLSGGLSTNSFGWRGPEIPLDKPPGTVRIAFVGASTTVGMLNLPFSYPEYVVHWLNLWAERNALSVRFDGINAGREGLSSGPIAAVARQEVLPAEPDLVVYYEGANQSMCVRIGVPAPPPRPKSAFWERVDRGLAAASVYSQIARRGQSASLFLQARGGYEPPKPRSEVDWPSGVDESHPDIDDPRLPERLKIIAKDLESARVPLAADGTELALSSFVWLVHDGLRLPPATSLPVYTKLNDGCWPYRYADIRRSVDLHNHVLEQYAARQGLPFLHVAELFPPDPRFFFDAVHLNLDGTRAHAWIVFRELLPIVRARLESGAWPRPDRMPMAKHPSIGPAQPYTLSCVGQPG